MVDQVRQCQGIHHVGIVVADLERSVRFYRDLLGLAVIGVTEEEDVGSVSGIPEARARFADLDAGSGQVVELIQYRTAHSGGPQPVNAVGSCHVSLRVADLGKTLEVLAHAGTEPLGKTATLTEGVWEGCTVVYLRDPDGLVVELIERRG